ncbi:uncharacterized protein PGRI_082050 [Penicillium griseofulvum]|uniref:Uncharacterized protein n=1 Tax=Penicillium patulum TaxID=5078 RepID=A0A135LVG0_PENPA|nr:uncharacterized protein PGRI_082050 [Penicillium griseofulvum]KXG52950.1 hypothetical protein PGRI_082050 [Penicillium griseofulvum]
MSRVHAGTIVRVQDQGRGQFAVSQPKELRAQPPRDDIRIPIHFSWEIVSVDGYIDLDTGVISLTVSILGIDLGTFTGSLKDGIEIKVDLWIVSGSLKFYVDGDTLYLNVHAKVRFDGSYDQDHIKVISW